MASDNQKHVLELEATINRLTAELSATKSMLDDVISIAGTRLKLIESLRSGIKEEPSDNVKAVLRKEHDLKTDPEVFDAVACGQKTFEIRRDDRGFRVGDSLLLRRTKYTGRQMRIRPGHCPLVFTGETERRTVSHVLRGPVYGLEDGWAILSFKSNATGAPPVSSEEKDYQLEKYEEIVGFLRSRLAIQTRALKELKLQAEKSYEAPYNGTLFSSHVIETVDDALAPFATPLSGTVVGQSETPASQPQLVEERLEEIARKICHAVEQRSDDCDMEMHARVMYVLREAPSLPEQG